MSDFLKEDLPTMFEDFGEAVRYDPDGAGSKEITALVDLNAEEAELLEGDHHIIGYRPMITIMDAELPALKKGDTFRVRGLTYRARRLMPENEGERDIYLEKV